MVQEVMDMREENWEIFVRAHCGQREGLVIYTPHYVLIAENFPIQLVTKLISTAVSSSDIITRICAARLIHNVAQTSRHFLQKLNTGITFETLELFRRSAIDLMLNHSVETEFHSCGEFLTAKLLGSSLESNTKWDEFLELTKRGFSLSQPGILHSILQIFCVQPFKLARKFVTLVEPSIRANQSQFVDTLLNLLQAGNDDKPYYVLIIVCGLFPATICTILMEGAIMFPFFDNVFLTMFHFKGAMCLKFCIEHAADVDFSPAMIHKHEVIIQRLYRSTNLNESHVALELNEAYVRRLMKVPKKCRQPRR